MDPLLPNPSSPGQDNPLYQHLRSYRTALKSTRELTIHSLTSSYLRLNSILHPQANNPNVLDLPAFAYCLARLPSCIHQVHQIVLGQTEEIFTQAGYSFAHHREVTARARRRFMFYSQSKHNLACYITSVSDLDDLVNILIAYEIERNKLHQLLKTQTLAQILPKPEDLALFLQLLGPQAKAVLQHLKDTPCQLKIQLLAGSWVDYTKTSQKWWKELAKTLDPIHISHLSLYFVSSNSHSLLNLITGQALAQEKEILKHLEKTQPQLLQTYAQIQNGESLLKKEDFLYYASRFCLKESWWQDTQTKLTKRLGIQVFKSSYLDLSVQLIPISALTNPRLDPHLKITHPAKLNHDKSYILNIDYPLGFTAYHLLAELMENTAQLKGLYVLGKAAVLNGELGDLLVPRLVYDEHSQNSYLFHNCFNHDLPFTNLQGSILTNQKAASVLSPLLENDQLLQDYSQNNITVIEMESGPYLSAVAEATYDQRLPQNTIIDLNNAPFDIGILNYASDTPYSQTKNLGMRALDLQGAEPTYLASRAILNRIITLEQK